MNALAEMPRAARPSIAAAVLPSAPARGTYVVGLLAALGIHAAILFAWPKPAPVIEQVEFGVESADASVEISLVAAAPAEEPVAVVEPPPEPVQPPPPDPVPEPPPIAELPPVEPVKAEMTIPEPEPPKPVPPRERREKPKVERKELPKPAPRPPRAVGDGSSKIPGNDATTAKAASGADSAKPGYLRNPHPAYPEAARAAKQQGLVQLFVSVDAGGNVTGIRITRSSGFPLLDERARSTVASGWRFKPARSNGVPIASSVTIPIRFTFKQ